MKYNANIDKYTLNSTKLPSLGPGSHFLLCWRQVEQTDLLVRFEDLFHLSVVSNHGFACQAHPAVILGGEDPFIGNHT